MQKWTLQIRPHKSWLDINLRDIWRYRDLLAMYVKRDIIVVYKQTILGPIWFLVQPLLTTIMYMFVFGGLAGIDTDGLPQPVFYLAGVLLWTYFQSVFQSSSQIFVENANVFGKVYFPRLIVPLSKAISNLVKLSIQIVLFLAVYLYYIIRGASIMPRIELLLFPLLILLIALHSLSWGIIISSLTTKYRDLTQLVSFGLQLFMYATPVIYPLSVAPERYRFLVEINPLSSIFEAFRYCCTGVGAFSWWGLLYSTIFAAATMFLALVIFNRVENNFMDTV